MTSRPYAEVIGDPISHSKSPLIHNFWLEMIGLSATYRAEKVRPETLDAYLDDRRRDPLWAGCNVTMPLKLPIRPLLDSIEPQAAAIGAVNTVRRGPDGHLHGRNTDVHGIWRALDGLDLAGRAVALVGTGGAARSAAFALRTLDVGPVAVLTRSPLRGDALLAEFGLTGRAVPLARFPEVALVVNASPLGMNGDRWPALDLSALPAGATIFDMVYEPRETQLLEAGRARGLRCIGGLTMLVHQAAEAFATLFGQHPPATSFAELERRLVA